MKPIQDLTGTGTASAVSHLARRLAPDSSGPGRVLAAVDRLADFSWPDPALDAVQRVVRSLPLGPLRDGLHGRWLGHPLHPVLVQVPIGAWLSAAVLDLLPARKGATVLVGLGLAGAGPAALAGWVDWAELRREQQRVGVVHAVANVTGVALYGASLVARIRGQRLRGRTLGFAGLAVVSAGGALGGHLAYRQAAGANHAEGVGDRVGPGWHALGSVAEFPVGEPVRRMLGEVPVVVVRDSAGDVHVLAERCSHLGGPLSQGAVVDGCVRCPWHGSTFRLADGWNVQGPATAPQPVFPTRVVDGQVEASRPTKD